MIRPYKEKDLNQVLAVWYSASLVAHPFLSAAFFDEERKNIATLYIPRAETWVYELDGVVVGFISLLDNEVGGLFVDAKFHRQGIGWALMDKAKHNRNSLELDVFKDNLVGRQFYQKYGFIEMYDHFDTETGFIQLRLILKN